MKKLIFVSITILSILVLGIFLFRTNILHTPYASEKIQITTTLFPLYDMATYIGGEHVSVSLLLPPGIEPHSFEPKPSDIIKIQQSGLFIYTGKFMEPWAEDIIKGINSQTTAVVDASTNITLLTKEEEEDHHDEEHESEDHDHEGVDPHIWLDFDHAKTMAETITNALIARDPAHTLYYQHQKETYIAKLTALDDAYRKTLSTCQSTHIIYGGHYAFGYLAKRYGLSYKAAQGFSPDAEPTAHDLVTIVDMVRKDGITAIFYEELTSPKIAETIAKETQAHMYMLHAAHNITKEQKAKGTTYFDIMEENLSNLSQGLSCTIAL